MWAIGFLLVSVGISMSLAVDVPKPTSSDVPISELTSNNVTARSLGSSLYQAVVPFVVRKLGMIECNGLDHTFGGNFFERIMGEGADFGGNYLCGPTCDGQCIPTQGLGEAPISIYYPFGCRCNPQRCGPNGPIVGDLIKTIFKLVCVRDQRCTCQSMGPGQLSGYLCNWINLNTNLPVAFLDNTILNGPPERSPIRWCSCCPNVYDGRPQPRFPSPAQ